MRQPWQSTMSGESGALLRALRSVRRVSRRPTKHRSALFASSSRNCFPRIHHPSTPLTFKPRSISTSSNSQMSLLNPFSFSSSTAPVMAEPPAVQPPRAEIPQPDQTQSSSGCQTSNHLHQPWRAFWPLRPGSHLYEELRSQHPQVLSWQFDREDLYNRPWHNWKSQPSRGVAVDKPSNMEPSATASVTDSDISIVSISQALQDARDDLDEAIELLALPAIEPKEFNYLAPLELYRHEKPYRLQLPPLDGVKMSNVVAKHHPVKIYDVSGYENLFTLEQSGFAFARCPVEVHEWTDRFIKEEYIPQLSDWLKQCFDCESTLVYSYNFRHHGQVEDQLVPVQRPWGTAPESTNSTGPNDAGNEEHSTYSINSYLFGDKHNDPYNNIGEVRADPSGPCNWKPPFFKVHCDAGKNTARDRLGVYFPEECDELMKKRIRLLSIWRPLSALVQDTPLALCDARTVNTTDMVPMDIVYPHFVDEVYEVSHSPTHRWFYKKGMALDEAIILKLHDTAEGEAKICPHSAFLDHSVSRSVPRRASIEVKVMIFG